MDSSVEASRPASTLTPQQPLGTKPRLAPKPFSLQKNSTIRSIHAPRTVSATTKSTINQSGKVEATGVPKVFLTTPVQKPPQQTTTLDSKPSPVSEHVKDKPKTTNESKESPQGEDPPGFNAAPGKSDPAPQTTSVPKVSLTTPVQKPPEQTITLDSKPSSVSEHVKDKPKTTNESKESSHGEDTPDSSVTPGKPDPAPQTTSVPKVSLTGPAQKPSQQITIPDSKPSLVGVHIKDKPKTTNESKESPQGGGPDGSSAAPEKSEPAPQTTSVPKVSLTSPVQKFPQQTTTLDSKPSPVSEHVKDKPKTTNESKESPHGQKSPDSNGTPGKSDPTPQTTPLKEPPQLSAAQKEDVIQTNHEAPPDTVTNSEQKDQTKKDDKTSLTQKPEESGSNSPSTDNPAFQWGGTRRRLSTKLTSKFESGGPPVSPNPTITVSATYTKDTINKPVSSAPEPSPTTPEPSNTESNEGGLDYSGGGSIKRRISQLFDSASRPEVVTKKEEPEIITSSGGVKDRIKNWVTETGSEAPKPQVAPRARSRSFDLSSPVSEKTPKLAPVELPATTRPSTQAVAPPLEVSPVKQPTETPMETSKDALEKPLERTAVTPGEHEQNKSTDVEVPLCNHSQSTDQAATNEGGSGSSLKPALKRNNVKRRSVRFGIVETDDGGPPLILGSPSDSSSEEEEEEAPVDKSEENTPVSVPVYRRVGFPGNKDDEIQKTEEEQQKHMEFEKRVKAEEAEQARLKLEEERKKQEEEERKKEKARQREELKRREEEKKREAERERERLKEEEVERQKKEERERERLKEEERKRQMELMLQRQREEERERIRQEEEQLRKYQEEMEKERQREERERQLMKEVEESSIHSLEGKLTDAEIILKKQKEEKLEEERVTKTERLRGEDEEGKELDQMRQKQKEEERERARQIEERLRQEEVERERSRREAEERERERQRKLEEEEEMREQQRQEEERKRRELEKRMQQEKEEEMERMRQIEKRREEERKEEETKRIELEKRMQQEKEEEMERMRQIEKRREEERKEEETKRIELERRMQQEKEEEMERMRQIEKRREEERKEEERKRIELERRMQQEKEEEMDRMRQIEKHREEEKKKQLEKERVQELERKMREELERKLRLEEEIEKEQRLVNLQERAKESNLISFDSNDVSQKSVTPHFPLTNTNDPPQNLTEIVYDDFSVRKPQIEVDFDDFSVKPKRWGSQAKVETHPVQSWRAEPVSKEEVEVLVPVVVHPQESKVPEQVVKPDSPEHIPDVESSEDAEEEEEEEEVEEEKPEEEQRISMDLEEEAEEEMKESEDELDTKEDEAEEEDTQEAQVNSYCINGEDKDTDALIESEPDQQNGVCEHTTETDSPKSFPEHDPEVSSQGVDTTDFHRKPDFAPFPESATPLLDTSAQRSKVDLSRRRSRTRPSRSLRLAQTKSTDWRVHDSTDENETSIKQEDSDSEEEQPKAKIVCSPSPASQRVPTVPGLSPATLIAQLKRRTGGRGDSTEEGKQREEKQSQREEVAQSPSQFPRSPRTAPHLAGAALVLPPLSGTEGGAVSSPAWLKELKSKKRLSQYDSET